MGNDCQWRRGFWIHARPALYPHRSGSRMTLSRDDASSERVDQMGLVALNDIAVGGGGDDDDEIKLLKTIRETGNTNPPVYGTRERKLWTRNKLGRTSETR